MKNKALFSRLAIAVCLVLFVICMEVFVFPLFSPTTTETPTTDAAVSKIKPSDDISKGITDVDVDSEKNQNESNYTEPTGYNILELYGCDDPDLTIWY